MSALLTGLILLIIALAGTLLSFLLFLLLRYTRRPSPTDPLAPSDRTLEALGYTRRPMRGPRGVELVVIHRTLPAQAGVGVRREREEGREGEELPAYERVGKDELVPPGLATAVPMLESRQPGSEEERGNPPEYEARTG